MKYKTRENGGIDKSYYRTLNFNGFTWYGYDSENDRHMFSKEIIIPAKQIDDKTSTVRQVKYASMECTQKCIDNGSAEYMAKHGLTYPAKK